MEGTIGGVGRSRDSMVAGNRKKNNAASRRMHSSAESSAWLGSMDSNHGMGASKAPALPLGDSPMNAQRKI